MFGNFSNCKFVRLLRLGWKKKKIQIDPGSVEVRVLCQGGDEGGLTHVQSDVTSARSGHIGTQKNFITSDWTKIQDGKWKADIWLDNNSKWQMGLWLDKKSRW